MAPPTDTEPERKAETVDLGAVARDLGVVRTTLVAEARRGDFPPLRRMRVDSRAPHWRVDKAALEAWSAGPDKPKLMARMRAYRLRMGLLEDAEMTPDEIADRDRREAAFEAHWIRAQQIAVEHARHPRR